MYVIQWREKISDGCRKAWRCLVYVVPPPRIGASWGMLGAVKQVLRCEVEDVAWTRGAGSRLCNLRFHG